MMEFVSAQLDWLRNAFSLAGAFCILMAYALLQLRFWTSQSLRYAWTNFMGGSLLLASAAIDRNLGFIILEGAWAILSLLPIVKFCLSKTTKSTSV